VGALAFLIIDLELGAECPGLQPIKARNSDRVATEANASRRPRSTRAVPFLTPSTSDGGSSPAINQSQKAAQHAAGTTAMTTTGRPTSAITTKPLETAATCSGD
jgi:hypothetical protein